MSNEVSNTTSSTELSYQQQQVPEHLRHVSEENYGKERTSQHIQPQRVKIRQATAKGVFKDEYEEGDVILVPQMKKIMDKENRSIVFAPLFFVERYTLQNPVGKQPFIVEQTTDLRDRDFIEKCQKQISQPHPDDPNNQDTSTHQSYVEVLEFYGVLPQLEGFERMLVMIPFFRGGHIDGRNFCTLMEGNPGAIWMRNYDLSLIDKENARGDQYCGLRASNPAEFNPWVSAEETDWREAQFKSLQKAHTAQEITVDYDDEEVEKGEPTLEDEDGSPSF